MIAIVPMLKLCGYSISLGLGIASGFVGVSLKSPSLLAASAILVVIGAMIAWGVLKRSNV